MRAILGEYYPRSFWYKLSEARSIQESLRVIFSQYGPELVRVNKRFITCIWMYLTPNYLKSEPWQIGMNEPVYRKSFKTQQFSLAQKNYIAQEKVRTFKETVSFHLASNYLNFLNQVYFDINFSIFLLYQPGINIAHNAHGHYGKIQPRVLTNHRAGYIYKL